MDNSICDSNHKRGVTLVHTFEIHQIPKYENDIFLTACHGCYSDELQKRIAKHGDQFRYNYNS